jgi:oligopeptide/dipeptide ABC transporter ATP-binding protein
MRAASQRCYHTDAHLPMSLGVPAVTIAGGGEGGTLAQRVVQTDQRLSRPAECAAHDVDVGWTRRRQRAQPSHPYTQGLIRSIPRIDAAATRRRRLESIAGIVPSPLDPLPGCRFAPRCPFARADCIEAVPPLREIAPGHKVACVL